MKCRFCDFQTPNSLSNDVAFEHLVKHCIKKHFTIIADLFEKAEHIEEVLYNIEDFLETGLTIHN